MEVQIRRNVHTGKITGFRDQETGSDLGLFSKSGYFISSSQKFSDWLLSQKLETIYENRDGIPYKEDTITADIGDQRGEFVRETWQEFYVDTFVFYEGVKIRVSSKTVSSQKLKNMLSYLHET